LISLAFFVSSNHIVETFKPLSHPRPAHIIAVVNLRFLSVELGE
jgi:hypothetical protein